MSKFNTFIKCDTNGMSLESILKSLFVKHTDGTVGIRTVSRTITSCSSLTPAVVCANTADNLEELVRQSVVLDACGKPALMLMNTVSAS